MPGLCFESETATGFYRPSDRLIAISASDTIIEGRLHVNYTSDNYAGPYDLDVRGTIGASGDITALYSDERLKTVTCGLEGALDIVGTLRTFKYHPNQLAESFGYSSSESYIGVSAQEIQSVYPEIVKIAPFDSMEQNGQTVSRSGENYLTVQYDKLVPVLIQAIKELKERVETLESQFN